MRKPEVLAPAGDADALAAALAAGADAVYFGLDEGFNARARAANFSFAGLDATLAQIHRAGARAYLALNTLVFESELAAVEQILARVAESGVDAIIVQDPAVALLARALCPALEVHASTQMTISSEGGARFAAGLGVTRVVVPRELSVDEIRTLAAQTPLELEVFIHGALCVSWSGQCLTSEAWGGRSANRGACAQSCRLPYDLVVDGQTRDLGDLKYLLSPRDLAGLAVVKELAEVGVHGLKIEGRQKNAAYVATATAAYRREVDALGEPAPDVQRRDDLARMALTYSRGFSKGFLEGSDHQTLVAGHAPGHRGALLGIVESVDNYAVRVERPNVNPIDVTPRAGMGVVFDAGHPEAGEAGGPLFSVEELPDGSLRLGFGRPGPDLARVAIGQRVWLNSDPAIAREATRLVERGEPEGRVALALIVRGALGAPLVIEARAGGHVVTVASDAPLESARGEGLTRAILSDKLGALGGTFLHLSTLEVAELAPGLHVPVSLLKDLRRQVVAALRPLIERGPVRMRNERSFRESLQPDPRARRLSPEPARLIPLCRTDAQLEAVIDAGLGEVELDWMELVGLGRAVTRARAAGLSVTVATTRVQKPGEQGFAEGLTRLAPDGLLARHWGAVMHFPATAERSRPTLHGDFSLNVTNSITARHLLALGLDTLTASHDLDGAQLLALVNALDDPARLTVTVHHHVPTFHTEHCVYAHLLSSGKDFRDCGRPCETHELALADRTGDVHPVLVDVGCRNTVFNARAQSAAGLARELVTRGVRRLRIELVRESREQTREVLAAWRDLLEGTCSPTELTRRVGAHEQFGVTRGTMRVMQ